jgi:hypothetical protein
MCRCTPAIKTPFCGRGDCQWPRDANREAVDAWKTGGGPRPAKRPDGWPTRTAVEWWTPAEEAIAKAMHAVEAAGGSLALTDAVILLGKARDRVADHVEGIKPVCGYPACECQITGPEGWRPEARTCLRLNPKG